MSDTTADIATIGIAVDSSPLEAHLALLDRWVAKAREVDPVAERLGRTLSEAFAKVPSAMGGGAASAGGGMYGPAWQASMTGATSGFVSLKEAANAAAGATTAQAAATAASTSGFSAHAIGVAAVGQALDGFTAATGRGTGATEEQAKAVRNSTAAHKSHGAAAYGNRLQMQELLHVFRAVSDEALAGGSIVRAFAMEWGRLQIAITSGEGGISGMLGRVAGFAGKLANPLALASGGVLALGAASVYGFSRYEEGQEALERSLNGRGRGNGLTQTQLNALARDSAAAGGLSTSEGVGLVARYTGAGLSGDLSGRLTEASKQFSRISGEGTDKGADTLAKAFADPIRGLSDLDRSLGFVDQRLRDQIEDLVHSGQLGRAQALELDALNKAMHGASDSTWGFTKSLSGAGNWISDRLGQLGHGVANALGYGSDEDNLEKNRGILKQLQGFDPVGNAPDIAATKAEIARLEAKIQQATTTAAANTRDAHERDLSGPITTAVRTALPELARFRSTTETLGLLRDALGDRDIQRFVSPDVYSSLGRAYDNTAVMARMNAPGVADRQSYDLSLSRIKDWGVEDQGLNAARRTELEILRSTGDVLRATTEAQRTYNLEIAKANEAADDRLRQAKQDSGLIGLSPYEKAKQQLRNEYLGDRGIIERDRVDSTRVLDDKDIHNDLIAGRAAPVQAGVDGARVAVTGFSDALDKAAGRLATFPPAGGTAGPFGSLDRGAFGGAAVGTGATAQPMFALMQRAIAAGATPAAAAGFAAGTSMESGTRLDPTADNGSHLGVAQWDSTRWRALVSKLGGGAMSTQAGQFNGIFAELGSNEAGAGRMLLGGRSIADGIGASDAYERPGAAEAARRRGEATSRANALLAAYPGDSSVTPSVLTIHPAVRPTPPIAATAEKSDRGVYGIKDSDIDKTFKSADPNAYGTILGDANRNLTGQIALLKVQAETFGQSTAAIKGAAAAQEMWNAYVRTGVTPAGDLAAQIKILGDRTGEFAQQQEDQARQQRFAMDIEDAGRSGLAGSFSGGLTAMAHGQSFGKAFSSGMSGLGDRLIGMGTNEIFGSIFGQQGKGIGTGLLGNLISGHFAGGTDSAPGGLSIVGESGPELVNLPKGAQVATAGQTSGFMGSRPAPIINMGDTHFHASGEGAFSDRQMDIMAAQHAETQQKAAEHVVRNMGQIQADARQYG